MRGRRLVAFGVLAGSLLIVAFAAPRGLVAQGPEPAQAAYAAIDEAGMREWLSYLASDQLQGRQVFTEGYGLASAYVAERLRQWSVRPLGEEGTYFQTVRLRGYRVTRNSSITIEAKGESRTFKHGDHVTFPINGGGKQTLTYKGFQFVGSASPAQPGDPGVLKGQLAVWIAAAPQPGGRGAGGAGNRGRGGAGAALRQGAAAVIGLGGAAAAPAAQAPAAGATRGNTGRGAQPDMITVQRVDGIVTPQVIADETVLAFLFQGAPVSFADVKAAVDRGEAVAAFTVPDVKVTIAVDNTFEVVSEQLTRNVVGMVEGSDPALKNTYVMFGAHLDHVGYSQSAAAAQPVPGVCRERSTAAQAALRDAGKTAVNPGRARGVGGRGAAAGGRGPAAPAVPLDQRDGIYNGADDDGSGSTAVLAIAKAFATGPKPRRSVVFVWHSGEEADLYGSRYNADFPVVPLDQVQAVLNIDMVGRDDCNNMEGDYTNTLFIVGADRISTDLHNVIVATNRTAANPLTLDYELNDTADPENLYTRSDHYSYAMKGIPVTFFTTGLHPDYHRPSDSVDKILFPKMARIAQLIYQAGFSIADSARVLERDNKGPRTGFGSKAEPLAR